VEQKSWSKNPGAKILEQKSWSKNPGAKILEQKSWNFIFHFTRILFLFYLKPT